MQTIDQLLQDFYRHRRQFDEVLRILPTVVGTEGVRLARNNFATGTEGFDDGSSVDKWQLRIPGSPGNQGRPILTKSGNLKDSIRYVLMSNRISIGVNLSEIPYAKLHNEGGIIAKTEKMKRYFWAMYITTGDHFWKNLALSKKASFTIAARRFLGHTPQLDQVVTRIVSNRIQAIFNNV